jgi:hypothetical protein
MNINLSLLCMNLFLSALSMALLLRRSGWPQRIKIYRNEWPLCSHLYVPLSFVHAGCDKTNGRNILVVFVVALPIGFESLKGVMGASCQNIERPPCKSTQSTPRYISTKLPLEVHSFGPTNIGVAKPWFYLLSKPEKSALATSQHSAFLIPVFLCKLLSQPRPAIISSRTVVDDGVGFISLTLLETYHYRQKVENFVANFDILSRRSIDEPTATFPCLICSN